MRDLTIDDARLLALAAGITVFEEDLPSITHILNAQLRGLALMEGLPLDGVEPMFTVPHGGKAL